MFSASKCDVGNWIFSKSWNFFWNFSGGILLAEFSLQSIFWGIFWKDFFGRIFLEWILWNEFCVYIGIDFFVKILSQGKEGRMKFSILRSASASISHLKKQLLQEFWNWEGILALNSPKNERNFINWKLSQRLFFGRIEDTINCFQGLLTFS